MNVSNERRASILAAIRAQLPFPIEEEYELTESSLLADLGVNSMHLITLLLALQQDYAFDPDRASRRGMPETVGELISFVEQSGSDS
jgi:acyl carrier protein